MLAISFKFLAGRYHATKWGKNVNEDMVDWPPSPWRILRTIIASWKKTSNHIRHEDMEPILEKIVRNKVSFNLPKGISSHTRHYMPGWKETSTNIIDSFIAINPQESVVVIWNDLELEHKQKEILEQVIKNIKYFGRMESWCSVEYVEEKSININCSRLEEGDDLKDKNVVQVLCAKEDASFAQLCIETGTLLKEKIIAPPGSEWIQYKLSNDALTRQFNNTPKPEKHTNLMRFRIAGNPNPRITEILHVSNSLRLAAMSKYGQENNKEVTRMFTGKYADGKPMKENHQHAFFLPTDEDGDNILDHMTIIAREPFDEKEINALASITWVQRGQHGFKMIFLGGGNINDFKDIPILKKNKKWRSETPFVLNRHIKIRGKSEKCVVDGPEDQLRLEIKRRFPDVKIKNIKINQSTSTMKCGLKPIQFSRWRKDKLSGFGAYDVEIEFDKEMPGPLSFGHGSHFGLGMFVPR